MSRYREWDLSCKVYVGNLGSSASKHEIESAFSKYGPLRNVWVARNPPGFAFVEFEDPRDAEDAVRGLDGTRMCGTRVRVEMSSGRSRRGGGGGGGRRGSAPTRYSRPDRSGREVVCDQFDDVTQFPGLSRLLYYLWLQTPPRSSCFCYYQHEWATQQLLPHMKTWLYSSQHCNALATPFSSVR
ncbi:hypothetical protein C0J52_03557 [Blattella germanica]|nr:hypothetical protein C0J52_03557 [Blattella germanica]